MARPLRIDFEGAWHHVMHRGSGKQAIFLGDADRFAFLELLERIHVRFALEVNAYCMMGNHYHLLVRTPEGQLSEAMQYLNGVYTQRFNRRHGTDGALFRGRFASKLVETDDYLNRLVRYIHRNPIDIGYADRLPDYPWSSYPAFLQTYRPTWLFTDALWADGVLSKTELRRRTETSEVEHEWSPEGYREVIGSESYIAAALKSVSADDETRSNFRATIPRPTAAQIREVVSGVCASGRPFTDFELKLVVLGLCQEISGLGLKDLAEEFGYSSAKSAGAAAFRFRQKLQDPSWAIVVEKVRQQLVWEGALG